MKLADRIRRFLRIAWDVPTPKTHEPRTCSECGQRIKRNHKWFYFEDSQRHKDCSNPELKPIEQLAI